LEAFLDALIDNENYKQKKKELTDKKSVIENKMTRLKGNNLLWVERTKEFIFCALECAKIARAENNCHLLSQMAKKVGSKYFLKDQKIEFSLLPPFQALAASPLAASATLDSSRIFPLYQEYSQWTTPTRLRGGCSSHWKRSKARCSSGEQESSRR